MRKGYPKDRARRGGEVGVEGEERPGNNDARTDNVAGRGRNVAEWRGPETRKESENK